MKGARGMRTQEPIIWWDSHLSICGNDGEGDEGGEGGGSSGGTGTGGTPSSGEQGEGGTGEGAEGGEEGDEDEDIPDTLEEIKAALKKERAGSREAKALRRENARLQKLADEAAEKDKSEKEKAEGRATKAEGKLSKLAVGYKNNAVDRAIEQAARDARFHDPGDAIAQINRSSITVEQDDDDPTDVTVDKKSVVTAVKALAAAKKHLVKPDDGSGDGEPSGGKFGGGQKPGDKKSEEALRVLYPSL
jgi:DNA-binding transcriptional MerR regulator